MTSKISFQLWSSRKDPSLSHQLEVLSAAGYPDVQPHHFQYGEPAELRRQLDAFGLTALSSHIHYDMLAEDQLATTIAAMRTIGTELVIMPWLPDDLIPQDQAGWEAVGREMAGHAVRLADDGMRLAWHNHDREMMALPDGSCPIEHVLGESLLWEIDIGWTVSAGADPLRWLKRYAGRVPAVHVKDVPRPGENPEELGQTTIGAGTLDWETLWPACIAAGAELMVAEHDQPIDYVRFARDSIVTMQALQSKE